MMVAWWLALLLATGSAAVCAIAVGALRSMEPESSERAGLFALASDHERTHRALGVVQLLSLLLAGMTLAKIVVAAGMPTVFSLVVLGAGAFVVVLVGESAPRAVGQTLGAGAVTALHGAVTLACLLVAPIVAMSSRVESALERRFPRSARDEEEAETFTEQFRQVVATEAHVSRDETAILHGVFSLADTMVDAIMVPRVDVVGVERSTPWSEVVGRIRSSEHARLPVFDDTIDNVVGILYAKDALPAVLDNTAPEHGWARLVRPALFIPGSKTIDTQLRDFKSSRTHIAIVVDEYGGTAGNVTIEDILEEIVGEIRDEYDVEEPPVEGRGTSGFSVSGRLTLAELSAALDHEFQRDDVSTVGGLIYEQLGRVPRTGEELTIHGFRVVVERVERRKVARVYFERIAATAVDSA